MRHRFLNDDVGLPSPGDTPPAFVSGPTEPPLSAAPRLWNCTCGTRSIPTQIGAVSVISVRT
jgi:hypothetical protein